MQAATAAPAKRTAARDSNWFSSNSSRMRASVSAVSRPSRYFIPVTSTIGRRYSSRGPLRRRSRLRGRTRASRGQQQRVIASGAQRARERPSPPGQAAAPRLSVAQLAAGQRGAQVGAPLLVASPVAPVIPVPRLRLGWRRAGDVPIAERRPGARRSYQWPQRRVSTGSLLSDSPRRRTWQPGGPHAARACARQAQRLCWLTGMRVRAPLAG